MLCTNNRDSVVTIAHRGARSLAPENTLYAAHKALETGADAWEIDVRMTRDGHLVLIHDETLERVTNVATHPRFTHRASWRVADYTLEELKTLDCGGFFVKEDPFGQIECGAVTDQEVQGFLNMAIPTLEEGLRLTRDQGFRVNIEIKNLAGTPGHEVVVERVLAMIRAFDLVEQTLISSFHFDYLRMSREMMPEVPTAALMDASNREQEEGLIAALKALKVDAWHPDKEILTPHDLKRVLEEGLGVNVYTVNDPKQMRSLAAQGVTGLITDFPQRVE